MHAPHDLASRLCLACGLCCNGVLFRDVELRKQDDPARLRAAGLRLRTRGEKRLLRQPCAALDGCRCRCYPARPLHCRLFECALYQAAERGDLHLDKALHIIRSARRRVARVRQLLAELGEQDDHLPLRARFGRLARRLHAAEVDQTTGSLFSRLTLAVHELNLRLRDAFYPGAEGRDDGPQT